jgi:hypothetical protein
MATGCILVYPMQLAIAAGAAGDYLFQSFGSGWIAQHHDFWLRKLLGFCIVCKSNFNIESRLNTCLIFGAYLKEVIVNLGKL